MDIQDNNKKNKFNFVQADKKIQDEKFDTKPVSYFKDAFRRFKKNKSSVVALYIIIFLLVFAILAQVVSPYKTTDIDGYYRNALPKTTAFSFLGWDGSKTEVQNQAGYDIYESMSIEKNSSASNVDTNPIKKVYSVTDDIDGSVYKMKIDSYYKIGYKYINMSEAEYLRLQAYQDAANIQIIYPLSAYYSATSNANFWYVLNNEDMADAYYRYINAKDPSPTYSGLAKRDENGNLVPCYLGTTNKNRYNYYSKLRLDGEINSDGSGNYLYKEPQKKPNGQIRTDNDGNIVYTEHENYYYQYAVINQTGYLVRVNYYEYYRYLRTPYTYNGNILLEKENGNQYWNEEECRHIMDSFTFDLKKGFYPEFWFGTNDKGKDIFTLLGSGARLSFILAIFVSLINLTIGTIYGAIEGYFGGTLDLVMERICDVLSGVPFIVVATLFSLHLAEKLGALPSLIFAFIMTGWIGMSARVRMQFYRFKGQEYVLAARTLGIKNSSIMFKHILPNALGTIITGSILSIPSVIFSESMLSYLGIIDLETSGFTSIGTLLSNGSNYISTNPHIVLFPSLFISLLMISFNLFGNGLRDAFNPSLRGADE